MEKENEKGATGERSHAQNVIRNDRQMVAGTLVANAGEDMENLV